MLNTKSINLCQDYFDQLFLEYKEGLDEEDCDRGEHSCRENFCPGVKTSFLVCRQDQCKSGSLGDRKRPAASNPGTWTGDWPKDGLDENFSSRQQCLLSNRIWLDFLLVSEWLLCWY